MLQLENQTPFAASMVVLPDRHGVDTLYVVAKGTCSLRPQLALAREQMPIVVADEYFGEPALSSIKYVSDLHIGKPGTDVMLSGYAWAPRGRPVTRSVVTMQVAERRKTLHVFGDRFWRNGVPSAPQPFERIPLVWERAFGGVDGSGESTQVDERNPVGLGFSTSRRAAPMEGQCVPNLEDPSTPLRAVGDVVEPACFAPLGPAWLPRRTWAGTYDEAWLRERAPYLPEDFDPRYLQSAPAPFAFDRYLKGGEAVYIEGATPDEPLAFTIPSIALTMQVFMSGGVHTLVPTLETIVIEPDAHCAALSWRAALPCNRQLPKLERVVVALEKVNVRSQAHEHKGSSQLEVVDELVR